MVTVRHIFVGSLAALLAAGCVACATQQAKPEARIVLLPNSWEEVGAAEPASTLGRDRTEEPLPPVGALEEGFTVHFRARFAEPTRRRRILVIPGVLDVELRPHDPLDRDRQNYPACPMPDGSVPVLEASLQLVSPLDGSVSPMPVGIPLALLDDPFGEHEVTLSFSGARWTLYVDGRLLDNDFPFGYPDPGKFATWSIDPEFVVRAEIGLPASRFRRTEGPAESAPVQYWTPAGHNSWVGDVVSLFHDGTYHLFYLYDRRGHQSKFGRGGHYFEHLSTRDFIRWTEHEAAVPIEEQWETFGTGTPFVADGRLCISYGYHTTRLFPRERTTLPAMYDYLERHGRTGVFDRRAMQGIAAGSSYSVSDDGVDFRKSGILFHPCENPSIYADPQGGLRMLANYGARGTWAADSLGGGWCCLDHDFPSGGDCTFFFRWGGYDYIVGGFTNLWSRPSADTVYRDVVAAGEDFYDGLCVPTVAEIFDGRRVMAGWVWLKAWGGTLVIHELVQRPDGRIGSKWMEELIPATTGKEVRLSPQGETGALPGDSFLLTFDVTPADAAEGRLSVDLLPGRTRGVQDGCGWSLLEGGARAQYSGVGTNSRRELSLREGGEPHRGGNYAVEKLMETDKPFTVRMVVKYDPKYDGSLVDTEIAGCRTMISYREKLKAERIRFFAEGMTVENVRVVPLAE